VIEDRIKALTDEQFPDRDPAIWYELSKDALDRQLSFVDAIDAKVGGLLGSGSALLGILVAVYALKTDAVKQTQISWLIGASIFYGVLALASFVTLMRHTWGTGPSVRTLEGDARDRGYTDSQIRWKAASTYLDDMERNETWFGVKVWGLRVTVTFLVLETASVALGLWSFVPR
jgi:hypothetical protein